MSPSARPAGPPRWSPGGLAWSRWALAMLGLVATPWMDRRLRQDGGPSWSSWTPAGVTLALALPSLSRKGDT